MKIISWIKENKLLVAILLFGAIFRFYKIDYQSVWLDEIHTLNESNPSLSFSEMYNLIKITEPHPPLYFILIKILFTIFGHSTFVLRCFSALIGIAGIVAIYKLGKEVMNKQVGSISALLLSLNYFHLYHSQDGRMYALLFLSTAISFYYLIKFIKNPNYKTAIFSGFFASLMIYTHFFALFALFAQYVILLFFVAKPYKITTKKFFTYSAISGLTTLILYLPCLGIFLAAKKRTSIWIPVPGVDAFTQIFKEFFGNSELILFFVIALLFYFFMELFKRKSITDLAINPESEKQIFSFFFLFSWITVTLVIPLILSFINLPMIISRYFINILPAFIILIAIGIYYIKNNIVKLSVVSLILLFSFVDIVVVKKYYKDYSKSQFRDVSQFIIDNNLNNDKVVTTLSWYFPYFLNNDKIKTTLVDKTLDAQVSEMMQDSTKIAAFWYVNAHGNPYKVSDETQKFLDTNFEIENSADYIDAWTKHFVKKSAQSSQVDIAKYQPLKSSNGDTIIHGIDSFVFENKTINISGWAALENQDATDSKTAILLINNNKPTIIPSQKITRVDVTKSFNNKFKLDNSGFSAAFDTKNLPKGRYQLALFIKNKRTQKEGLIVTDKFIEK